MGLTLRVVALSGEGQSLINSLKRRTTVSSIFKAASLFGANSSILFVFGSPNSDDISSNAGLMKSTYQSAISKSRSLAICTRTPWHGNNRMERINLPMPAQGGFDYRDPAGLFRRQRPRDSKSRCCLGMIRARLLGEQRPLGVAWSFGWGRREDGCTVSFRRPTAVLRLAILTRCHRRLSAVKPAVKENSRRFSKCASRIPAARRHRSVP